MKAHNGGVGMSDDKVKTFIDRYIPGYVFFGDVSTQDTVHYGTRWAGKGLKILLNDTREMVDCATF